MAEGEGKYDDVCTLVREATGGSLVMVLVVNGVRGSGFSIQSASQVGPEVVAGLLESMAKGIRAEAPPH